MGHIRPTGEALDALERFLPHIDNWATCDITACGMKTLGRAPAAALPRIYEWLASRRTYTVRFGVVALLAHYLDEKFDTHHLDRLTALPGGEYYVDMAVAWGFQRGARQAFRANAALLHPTEARPPGAQQGVAEGRESLRIERTPAKRSCNVSNTDLPCPMETNRPDYTETLTRHGIRPRPSVCSSTKRLSVFTTHSV